MSDFLPILALAVACYVLRLCFVVLVPAGRLPAPVRRALGHLAPAMLAALVTVTVVTGASGSSPASAAAAVAALGAVAFTAWRTGSLTWAVAVGVAAVLVLDLVL